jgi:hypothetical protein
MSEQASNVSFGDFFVCFVVRAIDLKGFQMIPKKGGQFSNLSGEL